VEAGPFFSGNAIAAVDAEGRLDLPPFVLDALRCGDGRRLFFGAHPSDPCLAAYAPARREGLYREVERERLGDGDEAAHARRARRAFGFVEESEWGPDGRVTLPPMMRRKGAIGALALLVGAGPEVEIWSPERALDAGDPQLREMAAWRLEERETRR
jgi:MraZ protein